MAAAAHHPEPEGPRFSRSRLLGRGALLGLSAFGASVLVPPARADLHVLRREVDLSAMGAIGDGSADDTDAIRRAIGAVGPGGTVRSGPGRTYLVSSSIVVGESCLIDLGGSTIKKAAGMTGAAIAVAAADVTLRNAKIDGNREAGALGPGIDVKGVNGLLVDVAVARCDLSGFVTTTNPNTSVTCIRCSSSDNRSHRDLARGFEILLGVAKLYGCVADRNEGAGFLFDYTSSPGCHVDGVARENFIGFQIRSRGGTSHSLLAERNMRYGVVLDHDPRAPRQGGWTFGRVECNATGVGVELTGTGIELIGADRNVFHLIVSKANPGYGIALTEGSSYNTFRRVVCDQRGSGDGDPGLHISGSASYNHFERLIIRHHTFGVIFGEGYTPLRNEFNSFNRVSIVDCQWGVLRMDAGSRNHFKRIVSRRNNTIDPTLTDGLIDFRTSDTHNNMIEYVSHDGRVPTTRARFLVHGDQNTYGNSVRTGTPLKLLRRRTRDGSGRNAFFT